MSPVFGIVAHSGIILPVAARVLLLPHARPDRLIDIGACFADRAQSGRYSAARHFICGIAECARDLDYSAHRIVLEGGDYVAESGAIAVFVLDRCGAGVSHTGEFARESSEPRGEIIGDSQRYPRSGFDSSHNTVCDSAFDIALPVAIRVGTSAVPPVELEQVVFFRRPSCGISWAFPSASGVGLPLRAIGRRASPDREWVHPRPVWDRG